MREKTKYNGNAPGRQNSHKKAERQKNNGCPYAKKCGGCDYQGTSYEKQLKEKQKLVQKYVGKFCKVQPIIGMEHP